MTVRILVDLSHNENYTRIPDKIFDLDFIFDFLSRVDSFPNSQELKRYDLIIIGEVIPSRNQKDHLFYKTEIQSIKKYVTQGGRVLITTSSGGDFDYKYNQGSLRVLSPISGVSRFWWGELFHKTKGKFFERPENLVITKFPNHTIFKGINKIILADCTFLETVEKPKMEEILHSDSNTYFRYYYDDYEEKIGRVPLIVTRIVKEGKVITTGSTLFMTKNKKFGIFAMDNKKLFKNIIDWLLE